MEASRHLRSGDSERAEQVLAPLFGGGFGGDPQLLNIAGLLRLSQGRFENAAGLFAHARIAVPNDPQLPFNLGRALAGAGQTQQAEAAFRDALAIQPDYAEAGYELGSLLFHTQQLDAAETVFVDLLQRQPGHTAAKLMLGAVLLEAGRPAQAEAPLRQGLKETTEPRLMAVLHNNLGLALRRQRKDHESLAHYEKAGTLDPMLDGVALHRGEALQNLRRHDEALMVMRDALDRNPGDPTLHHFYNDLLYRLDRRDEYLKSYDSAPQTPQILLSKAYFLSHEKRAEEALEVYRHVQRLDPDNRKAAGGIANALNLAKRHGEAGAAFEALLARDGGNCELYGCAAESAILDGDPQKALAFCEKSLALAPYDQIALATMGTAWRMMNDERDEHLNGYDTLIQSTELEPPDGFSSMEDFNAELNGWLDQVHPQTREYLNQSLRGGTQTPDLLFGQGHVLVTKLQTRIDEALTRYIAALKDDERHPFLARRARKFGYAGSWSSRLRDCGFHVNHIHPDGWISSCYYVAVPDAVKDPQQRQGWIKFGEPTMAVTLKEPIRRAIQPVPGRLVLFPSYMWHGTVPFHDAQPRTTIAFDVVPKA